MNRLKHGRPSPALIVAVIALVAALAGTAIASNPQATSSAINKKKVKQIAKKQANKAVANALPIGSGELATIDEHTTIETVPGTSHRSITAACESNETVISGGFRVLHEGSGNLDVRASHREGNTWRANLRNNTAVPREFRVHAYCLTEG
jgi:uncharacterized protein (UPF0333 family)